MAIKICHLTFEEVETQNHWADFARFGKCIACDTKMYSHYWECDFELPKEEAWQISFDQSTSCTGVMIKNFKNTHVVMAEVSKSRQEDADDFIYGFEMFMHKICEGRLITHLIYERPINTGSYRSSQVLFQLEGIIRAFSKRYEEFKTARVEYIENSSWRRVVILPKYVNEPDRKHASEMSVRELFQWPSLYGPSIGHDKDIFEAIGVMFGWFCNAFDELGRPYVRGDRFTGNIGGFVLPGVSANEVAEELKQAGLETAWAMQNPRKSIYENLACAVEKHKVVCVELNSLSAMLALTIECGIKWMNPDKMTAVLVASNYADSRLFAITGNTYHFIL